MINFALNRTILKIVSTTILDYWFLIAFNFSLSGAPNEDIV